MKAIAGDYDLTGGIGMTSKSVATIIGLLTLCLIADVASAEETVSFESVNKPNFFIRHRFFLGELTTIDRSNAVDVADATFIVRPALSGTPGAVSFESVNYHDYFLRHENFRLRLDPTNTDHHPQSFREDASFLPGLISLAGVPNAVTYASVNFPGFVIRHRDYHLFVEKSDGSDQFFLDSVFQKRPALTVVSGGGGGGNQGGGGISAEAQAIIDAHNGYRAKHCVPPLTWSADLAAGAQQWANGCQREADGSFKHSKAPGLGESLYWAPPGAPATGKDAVDWWYREAPRYDYNNPYASYSAGDTNRDLEVRHFTQLVWRATTQVGCAKAQCGNITYWVCRYAPPGNFNAQNPGVLDSNVPPPCK
jgi:cysteine-rich secretory family protein/alpha-L-arabinofuranosidase B-like protein